eukprot:3226022-Lingulodinium_polyedra.AAC.1
MDLSAAFASVLRQHIVSFGLDDTGIARLFDRFGIRTTIPEFARALQSPTAAELACLDPHLSLALRATL